jgi:biopolymer transport protein ExbD
MQEGTVNVTPLIDIVMCLIIFFMLVAKIGVATGAEEIDIPGTRLGTELQKIGVESSLVLNVRESSPGTPIVTAIVEADGGFTRSGTAEELKVVHPITGRREVAEALRHLRYGRDGKPGGSHENADNPEFKVVIRGDRAMSYAALEPILVACMEANVKNVNFNTKKTGE